MKLIIHRVVAAYDGEANEAEQMVLFCLGAAQEAHHAVHEAGGTLEAAKAAASEAYKNAMPKLTHHALVRFHIACVAQGVALNYITGKEAKLMLYAAQLALAALRRSNL